MLKCVPLPLIRQGRDDIDEEDRFSALLLQRLLLLFRHLGHRGCYFAACTQQRHHPAPYLHHSLLLHGASNDTDPPAAGIHPDVVRHAGTGQEDPGGFKHLEHKFYLNFSIWPSMAHYGFEHIRNVMLMFLSLFCFLQEFLLKEEYRVLEYNLTTTEVELVNVSASWDEVGSSVCESLT